MKIFSRLCGLEKEYHSLGFIDTKDGGVNREFIELKKYLNMQTTQLKKIDTPSALKSATFFSELNNMLQSKILMMTVYNKIFKFKSGNELREVMTYIESALTTVTQESRAKELENYKQLFILEINMLMNLIECKFALLEYESIKAFFYLTICTTLLKKRSKIFYDPRLRETHNKYNNIWKWMIKFQLSLICSMAILFHPLLSQEDEYFKDGLNAISLENKNTVLVEELEISKKQLDDIRRFCKRADARFDLVLSTQELHAHFQNNELLEDNLEILSERHYGEEKYRLVYSQSSERMKKKEIDTAKMREFMDSGLYLNEY